MARYRVLEKCFVQSARTAGGPRSCSVGEEIEFDGAPGTALLPLDNAARAAKLLAINPNWRRQDGGSHLRIVKLARSLGSKRFPTVDEARNFIETWIKEQSA